MRRLRRAHALGGRARAAGGVPFPGNRLPEQAINPVARNVLAMYPLGNVSPSIYRATLVGRRETRDKAVVYRFDVHLQGPQETVFFDI